MYKKKVDTQLNIHKHVSGTYARICSVRLPLHYNSWRPDGWIQNQKNKPTLTSRTRKHPSLQQHAYTINTRQIEREGERVISTNRIIFPIRHSAMLSVKNYPDRNMPTPSVSPNKIKDIRRKRRDGVLICKMVHYQRQHAIRRRTVLRAVVAVG